MEFFCDACRKVDYCDITTIVVTFLGCGGRGIVICNLPMPLVHIYVLVKKSMRKVAATDRRRERRECGDGEATATIDDMIYDTIECTIAYCTITAAATTNDDGGACVYRHPDRQWRGSCWALFFPPLLATFISVSSIIMATATKIIMAMAG